MRTKLLRALAHLKAAREHVKRATEILHGPGCYWWDGSKAVASDIEAIDRSLAIVGKRYYEEVVVRVEPAEL
jgi:hypothetical protein